MSPRRQGRRGKVRERLLQEADRLPEMAYRGGGRRRRDRRGELHGDQALRSGTFCSGISAPGPPAPGPSPHAGSVARRFALALATRNRALSCATGLVIGPPWGRPTLSAGTSRHDRSFAPQTCAPQTRRRRGLVRLRARPRRLHAEPAGSRAQRHQEPKVRPSATRNPAARREHLGGALFGEGRFRFARQDRRGLLQDPPRLPRLARCRERQHQRQRRRDHPGSVHQARADRGVGPTADFGGKRNGAAIRSPRRSHFPGPPDSARQVECGCGARGAASP